MEKIIPGNAVQVGPSIVRITAPNPSVMTGPGTNSYIVGDRELVLVDPGPEIESHISLLTDAVRGRIAWIVCTHTHLDHSPAARHIKAATGAKIAGRATAQDGRQDSTFEPDRVLEDGDEISVAGVTLRALHTPGHASNHLCYLFEQQQLLFTGDHIMYVGPKSLPVLESVNIPGLTGSEPDLRALVDFGWLGVIARPLFLWLKWTYNHIVANWGWAILIQTVIINLALLPLRISQMKSMLKMQKIQPQVKSIQEKYKKYSLRDPRKAPMNEEIQALYKKEGVNPVGGCLPMVIQMPFLFAYYRMLGVAIDLRHEHRKDPGAQ